MTNQHPITPPPELVREWNQEAAGTHFEPYGYSEFIATRAAQWGADQELEACCQHVQKDVTEFTSHAHLCAQRKSDGLRAARRPKPPSLKEQATDEELYDYWISTSPQFGCADPVGFARAVLERWG